MRGSGVKVRSVSRREEGERKEGVGQEEKG